MQVALLETPRAEGQQRRANVGGSDVHAISSEENGARADTRAEVQVALHTAAPGEAECGHVGQRRVILNQGVPPNEVIEVRLSVVIKEFDRLAVADLLMLLILNALPANAAATLDLFEIRIT